jgi:hypothetical protein
MEIEFPEIKWPEIDFSEIEFLDINFLLALLENSEYQLYILVAGSLVFLLLVFLLIYLLNRLQTLIAPVIVGISLIVYFWQEWVQGDLNALLNPPALFFGALLIIGLFLGFRHWERTRHPS